MKSTNRIAASLVCLLVWASVGQAGSLVFINISPASVTMQVGDQQQFQAWGDDGNGNTLILTDPQWSIDGGATLTPISYTCIVKADQPGTYTLKCREGGTTIEGTATITINANLAGIDINPGTVSIDIGDVQQFTAIGKDQYGETATITNPVWSTSGGGTLNPSGSTCTYTATSAGSYTITCKENGTTIKGTATIYCGLGPPQFTAIDVSPANATLNVGDQQRFTATGRDQYTHTAPIITPEWWEEGVNVQNSTTTHTYTATRTGHFSLTCRDAVSGIEKTVGIAVKGARGDASELLETTGSPPPMTGHTLVSLKGDLYLFGGQTQGGSAPSGTVAALAGGSVLSSTWRLDGVEGRWEEQASFNPPPARHGHSAITYNGKIYVFGGQDRTGYFLNDLWEYNPNTHSWTERVIDPPLPGLSGATVSWTGKWTIAGGMKRKDGVEVPNSDVWDVNPNSFESSHVTQIPAEAGAGIPLGSKYSAVDSTYEMSVLDAEVTRLFTFDKAAAEWGVRDLDEPRPAPGLENVQVTRYGSNALITGTRTEEDQQTVESWAFSTTDYYWPQLTGHPEGMFASAGASLIAGSTGPSGQMASAAVGPRYQIILYGGQRTDGSLSDETIIYTPPYEEALATITVTPDSAQMHVGETVRFIAIGHDAEDFPTSLEPVWSATGGMIDTLGFFTATEEGQFAVIALDATTGIEGIASVTVE